MKRILLTNLIFLLGMIILTPAHAQGNLHYQQSFSDFVFAADTEILVFGDNGEWTFDATGSHADRLKYRGNWGTGVSAGFRGNDNVMGYQHTAATGVFYATLTLTNTSGETITMIDISYTGRVERAGEGRSPEWTVEVNGQVVPELGYSTLSGTDQEKSAQVSVNIAPGGELVIVWSSDRGQPTGASKQIGIADLVIAAGEATQVAAPVFDPPAGLYFEAQDVNITSLTDGASIHYTLDGSEPTENDFLFDAAIPVDQDMTIKARAFLDGLDPSDVVTAEYVIRNLLLWKDFEDGDLFSGNWTVYDILPGANTWGIDDFDNITYAMITEFGSDPQYPESWYLSPAIDLSGEDVVTFSFYSQAAFRTGEALSVKISSDYDGIGSPGSASWTVLDVILDSHSGGGFGSWTYSGDVDLSEYDGEVHIGFHYLSDPDNLGRWHINDILVLGGGEPAGDEEIVLSMEELPSFREVYTGNESDVQFYFVEANNLNENLIITAQAPMKVSLDCQQGFQQSLSLSPVRGSIAPTKIFVRAYPEAQALFNPQVIHTSGNTSISLQASVEGIASQIPENYYEPASGTGEDLMLQLHDIIRSHEVQTYQSILTHFTSTDKKFNGKVWDIFSDIRCEEPPYEYVFFEDQQGDLDVPDEEGHVYNREHSWPVSWWGGNQADTMFTDVHHIYPTDRWVNMQRVNYPYGQVGSPDWVSMSGNKVGANTFGEDYAGNVFEPIDDFKGDFARTYFYMVTRYKHRLPDWAGNNMVEHILDGTTYPAFEPWFITMLLEWHESDPVSQKEIMRNDAIYEIQGNRNPFIDNPEFAQMIWGDVELTPMAIIEKRPAYLDISSPESESAVLLTVKNYPVDDARYRLYSGINQYNVWNPETGEYVTSNSYSNGPLIPGSPTESTTFWVPFQRGSNVSTGANYRDRLGPAYSSNFQTTSLPPALEITDPIYITQDDASFIQDDHGDKMVVLAYDATHDGNLIAAASTGLNSGEFTIVSPFGVTIKRLELRALDNTLVETLTGTWPEEMPVSTPVFDPPGGNYFEPTFVNITVFPEDASIYYTTDGSNPDQNSDLFTEPIAIDQSTTLRARAYADGFAPSNIATAEYNLPISVSSIAELKSGTLGSLYRLSEEVYLTYQQAFRNQKYIQDETGGILIDDMNNIITTEYEVYDGITGLTGIFNEFGNMLQITPAADPGDATSTENIVEPLVISLSDFVDDFEQYQGRLVTVENVSFVVEHPIDFENGLVYEITDGPTTAQFRTTFYDVDYIGEPIPEGNWNITGLPNSRATGDFLTARKWQDFEEVEDVVATPMFNPPGGSYFTAQMVSISTATPGAIIYYTTDGSDPDDDSTPYTGEPIVVNATTTLQAIAYAPGLEPSNVASAFYQFPLEVSDIASLREGLTDGTYYTFTGEAVITLITSVRNQKYIQDDTGAILIDDNEGIITTEYDAYDGITGFTGSLSVFSQMLQFVPVTDPGPPVSSNNVVIPELTTLDDLDSSHQAKLIKVMNAVIDPDGDSVFQPAKNYIISDPTGIGVLRAAFPNDLDYVGEPIPVESQNITGVVRQVHNTSQLVPRSLADFEEYSGEPDTFSLVFQVVNPYGNSITDAVISLNGTANAQGDYVFENLDAGTYSYLVIADCYIAAEGLVEITSSDVQYEVVMQDIPGDANGDGLVNVLDAINILNYFMGDEPSNFCFVNADVNQDGAINVLDAISTLNIFMENKIAPHPGLQSAPSTMVLHPNGIYLESDGSLAGLQFKLIGKDIHKLEMDLMVPGHKLFYAVTGDHLRAMILSFENEAIPEGHIELIRFSRPVKSLDWLSVLAGNLNAVEVPVETMLDETTGLNDFEASTMFRVYPNPMRDVLSIQMMNPDQSGGTLRLNLTNLQGQIIMSEEVEISGSRSLDLHLSDVPSGAYLLELRHSYGVQIQKIIISGD